MNENELQGIKFKKIEVSANCKNGTKVNDKEALTTDKTYKNFIVIKGSDGLRKYSLDLEDSEIKELCDAKEIYLSKAEDFKPEIEVVKKDSKEKSDVTVTYNENDGNAQFTHGSKVYSIPVQDLGFVRRHKGAFSGVGGTTLGCAGTVLAYKLFSKKSSKTDDEDLDSNEESDL